MRSLPEYDILASAEDEPIILAGQPETMRGELRIANPGNERVVLREARVRSQTLASFASAKSDAYQVVPHAQPFVAILSPGQSQYLPLTVTLDRHTPPGEYHGEVEVAGRTRPVIMHVAENFGLDITPTQLVVENRGGAKSKKQVLLTNFGNVPLAIEDNWVVPLDEDLLICRSLRATLKAVDDEKERKLEDYLAEMARQAGAALDRAGNLRVRNTKGAVTLQPGERQIIELEIQLPEKLDSRSRYSGRIPLYTTDLEFLIVPVPGKQTDQSEKPPRLPVPTR